MAVGSCFDMDPDLPPEDALAQLDDLAGQTDIIVERCSKLNSCQEQCSVAQTDFKDPALLHKYGNFWNPSPTVSARQRTLYTATIWIIWTIVF